MIKTGLALVLALAMSGIAFGFDLDSLLVQSVGGPEAVEQLKETSTFYLSGPATIYGQSASYEMFVTVPDQIYLELKLGAVSMVQAFDGQTAWTRDQNGMVSELNGFEKQALLSQLYFQTYAYLVDNRLPGDLAYLGIEEHEGESWHKVAFYPLGKDTIYAYYDPETAYQILSVDYQDNLEVITDYSVHREFSGIIMAEQARTSIPGTSLTMDFVTDSVALNIAIDPSRYQWPASSDDFTFPVGLETVTISFDYIAGHIYVEALVNGKWLVFLLDSGASANIFDSSAVADLDLPVVGRMAVMGIAGLEEINLVSVDSMKIGGLILKSQIGGVLDQSDIGQNWKGEIPFGGVVGYDFLSRFPVMVDYDARQLTVYDPAQFEPPEGGYPVEFELHLKVPVIDAELNGLSGRYLVDLGNAFGLLVNSDYSRRHGLDTLLTNIEDISQMIGGVGGGVRGEAAKAASFTFGGVVIEDLQLLLLDNASGITGSVELAGNIGNLVLQKTRVLFNYSKQRLIFYDPNRSGE